MNKNNESEKSALSLLSLSNEEFSVKDVKIENLKNKLLSGRGQTPDTIAKFLTDVLSPMSRRHSY